MKIGGRQIKGPNVELIIIPRSEGGDIIFKAQAVLNDEEFKKLCPLPEPKKVMGKGGALIPDPDDKGYRVALQEHAALRTAWMILKSLEATPELEWETVKMDDPNSWSNYEKELRDSGFSDAEMNRVVIGVMNANALNDAKIEEARARFLREGYPNKVA